MSQLVDRLIEQTKPVESTAELIMRMVPLPDEIKLDDTFSTRTKKTVKELQNRVIDRIPAQDSHKRYHELASEVIDIADEMTQVANLVSWLITPIRGQYQQLTRGASLIKAARAYAEALINRKLVDRAIALAKELDPTGYAMYRMGRGEEIDWL
jgi:hypothetical protein